MVETLFAVVTDTNARSTEKVEAQLSEELSVGTPWYD